MYAKSQCTEDVMPSCTSCQQFKIRPRLPRRRHRLALPAIRAAEWPLQSVEADVSARRVTTRSTEVGREQTGEAALLRAGRASKRHKAPSELSERAPLPSTLPVCARQDMSA
eukprot:COSAG01_NODE_4363_length_5095_cov_2.354484_1_plen_112_part_00